MKLFLKLFLIMVPIFGFSAIDECKTDVYFANGILTKEKDAIKNADLLEKNIKQEVYANNDDKMYTHIGKVDSVRRVSWDLSKPYIQGEDTPSKRPTENYVLNAEVNKIYKEWWIGTEGWLEKLDSNVHAFTFYMGLPLKNGETNKVFINPFTNKNLIDSSARSKIMTAIKTKLDLLDTIDSQWQTNKESDKNTCDYRITVKHRFDPSIEVGGTVYPFNGAKKLYQVNGEYVKASCGGENILSAWDGKPYMECLKIDNKEEEKIYKRQSVSTCVLKLETVYCKLKDWSGGSWSAKTKEQCMNLQNSYLPLNGCHFSKPDGDYYTEPNGTDCDYPPSGWVLKTEEHIPEYDEFLGAHGYNSLNEYRVGDIETVDECKYYSSLWYAGWGSSLIGKTLIGLQKYKYYERVYVPKNY